MALVYKRFVPTGQALLTLAGAEYTREVVRVAKDITFTGGEKISASPNVSATVYSQAWNRGRGVKGRADALNRGHLGTGPSAGFPPRKTVTITGVPGRMTIENFIPLVDGFKLADEENSVMRAPL